MAKLWAKAQPVLWAFIQSSVRDFHHAEDILQEVAQQAAANFDRYDPSQPFTGWAIGISRNKVREYLRKRAKDQLVFSEQAVELISESFAEHSDSLGNMRSALNRCLREIDRAGRRL
ncbi:MAG: sigma-70 family RNA polymerase sigma factor, partial [Rhodospirillales bacterium]|nr:sigma-70 family RNA polymerase sigma factor [Rhodospirillales bacterium]